MKGLFRVELKVGTYSWTVTQDTKPASPGVLDGLRFGWRIPEGDYSTGMQPEPMTAAFGLVADDVATYADLAKGQNVGIKVWTHGRSGGTPEFSFYGRVSDLDAEPIKGGRTVYSLTAVDYDADLADATVGTSNWSSGGRYSSSEDMRTRLGRIFDEAGHGAAYGHPLGFEPLDPLDLSHFGPRNESPAQALDLVRDYLRHTITMFCPYLADGPRTHQNTVRIVAPYADENGLIDTASGAHFAIDYFPLTTRWTATLLPPFIVTRPGATVTVTSTDPAPDRSLIDACRVELGAKWRKDKASGINRVNFDYDDNGVTRRVSTSTRTPGDAHREITLSEGRVDVWQGGILHGYHDTDITWYPPLLSPAQQNEDYFFSTRGDALPNNWTFDSLTWHLTADESAAAAAPRRLMPNHAATTDPTDLTRWEWAAIPLVVLGIPRAQNLPGDTVTHDGVATGYTVGIPTGVELTFKRGHATLAVVLARRLPRTPAAFVVPGETNRLFQWDDFDPAPFTGATWNDVDDLDTWLNYRLSRRP